VDANWSGGVKPTATDDVVFNVTSVINCTLSENSVCKSLTSADTYSGTLARNAYTMTVSGATSIGSGTTLNMGTGIWYSGGSFTLNASCTFDAGSSTIYFTTDGVLTSGGKTLYAVTLTGSGKTYSTVGATTTSNNFVITNGSLTLGDALTVGGKMTKAGTGTMANGGFTVSIAGDGTTGYSSTVGGNETISGTLEITGDCSGDAIHFTNGAGTLTLGTCNCYIKGNGNLDMDWAGGRFLRVYAAYLGKTVVNTGSGGSYAGCINRLTLYGGTFTVNSTFCILDSVDSGPLQITAGTTINGTGSLAVRTNNAGTFSYTIPAVTFTGTGNFQLHKYSAGNHTFNINGALNIGADADLYFINTNASGTMTVTTNDVALTCDNFVCGNSNVSGTMTINFRASAVTCNGFGPATTYAFGTLNVNIGKASTAVAWSLNSAFEWADSATVTYTNISQVTFTFGTLSSTIYSNGSSFPNVILNGAGLTFYAVDAFTCYRLQVEPDTTAKFLAGTTHTVSNYTAGDWDGTDGHTTSLISNSAGTQATITNPGTMLTRNVDVKDIKVTNFILAFWSIGNINSGGNENWIFRRRIHTTFVKGRVA
jgi:hypothetical protein